MGTYGNQLRRAILYGKPNWRETENRDSVSENELWLIRGLFKC